MHLTVCRSTHGCDYPPTTYPQRTRRYLQYLTFVLFYMILYVSLHEAQKLSI